MYFLARKGLTGITGNIYLGLHEFDDMGLLLHFLKKGDIFFDIGANVGAYTLLAPGFCGAKSLTFEPIESTFKILEKNIEMNNLNNLASCYNTGVGKENGYLNFSLNEDTTNHVTESNEKNSVKVEIVNLDSFCRNFKPTLIKIDVEGFETEVLAGAQKILKSEELKATIIELNGSGLRYGYSKDKIHETLLEAGFTTFSYNPFNRQLIETPKFGNYNTIYLRDLIEVQNRLKTTSTFSLFGEKI